MNTGPKILLVIAAVVLLAGGNYIQEMVSGGYRWNDYGLPPDAGPLNYVHWKSEVQKHLPSAVEVPLENDPTQSFAFFFDSKTNQLILCWYRSYELHGGVYGVEVAADSWNDVKSAAVPSIHFTVRCSSGYGQFGEYSYVTGQFLQISNPTVSEFGFYFDAQSSEGPETITHFKAQRRGANGWVVVRI